MRVLDVYIYSYIRHKWNNNKIINIGKRDLE